MARMIGLVVEAPKPAEAVKAVETAPAKKSGRPKKSPATKE